MNRCFLWTRFELAKVLFYFSLIACSTFLIAAEPLIFYHIPKTGGTTLTFLLNKQFNSENICPDNFYYENEMRSITDLNRFCFIRGHFFVKSNLMELVKVRRITILRNPIDRILSEQRYFKQYNCDVSSSNSLF